MALQPETWRPDTCTCVIEQLHDPTDPTVAIQFSKIFVKCPIHTSVPDVNLWGVVYANPDSENKRKNLLHKALLETSSLNLSVIAADGTFQWKSGVSLKWSYNANRVLEITIVGQTLTNAQKTTVNNFCTAQFGANKVVLL